MMGTLYVVATPLGNLGDISVRALQTLREVDMIFCEDTRVTKKLLQHHAVETPVSSYHSFSGFGKIRKAIQMLENGSDVALVSDAGTPCISDPGVRFVREVRERIGDGSCVRTVPGPSALTAALSISGAPCSSFVFLGFLPRKKGRQTMFQTIATEKRTVIFYEAPHRLLKTLQALQEHISREREVIVCKELTKIYEQSVAGTSETVLRHFEEHPDSIRGEFVVIVSSLERSVQ